MNIKSQNSSLDLPNNSLNKIHIIINLVIVFLSLFLIVLTGFNDKILVGLNLITLVLSIFIILVGSYTLKTNRECYRLNNILIILTIVSLNFSTFSYFRYHTESRILFNVFLTITILSHLIVYFIFNKILNNESEKNASLFAEFKGYAIGISAVIIISTISKYISEKYYDGSILTIITAMMYIVGLAYTGLFIMNMKFVKRED